MRRSLVFLRKRCVKYVVVKLALFSKIHDLTQPLFTVEHQLTETIHANMQVSAEEAYQRALSLMKQVGIPQPENRLKQYPHQFSGGMRQRVVIAIALAGEPDLIIADEPTTALDVSIQDQILNLIRELCKKNNVGCMLVTHDMGVVSNVTDRVA